MTDLFNHTLHTILASLQRSISQLNEPGNLDGLLALHFARFVHPNLVLMGQVYCDPANWMRQNKEVIHHAPSLAVLGSLLAEQVQQQSEIEPIVTDTFRQNIARLQHRQNVFSFPNSWIWQPDVTLGITLGIKAIVDKPMANWLLDLLKQGFDHPNTPLLPQLIYGYAANLLGGTFLLESSAKLTESTSDCSIPELALMIWLAKRETLMSGQERLQWLNESQPILLQRLLTETPYEVEDYKAAIVWETATSYVKARSRYPGMDLVTSLLDGFLPAMERWQKKWTIEDEYDVQALLWLILRSSFEDARYEEYLPKLGRSGQRYDIGIPSLGLIVEAKYVRTKGEFQKIVDEIGKDSAQLQPQSLFTAIVVFVYDKSCSVENHEWVRQTLESIALVKRAIIVPAPATSR